MSCNPLIACNGISLNYYYDSLPTTLPCCHPKLPRVHTHPKGTRRAWQPRKAPGLADMSTIIFLYIRVFFYWTVLKNPFGDWALNDTSCYVATWDGWFHMQSKVTYTDVYSIYNIKYTYRDECGVAVELFPDLHVLGWRFGVGSW